MERENRIESFGWHGNLLVLLGLMLTFAGCKKDSSSPSSASGDKVVNLYIFSEYIPDEVVAAFTAETGVKVNVQTLPNNEELWTKLSSGTSEYDVVSPSDYMVKRLAAKGLIRKLDRAKLSNFANLDPAVMGKPFDPGNEYSVPLFWGVTGIGFNKSKVAGPVDSWAVLFDERYKQNICMLDDSREVLAAALWKMGKTPNERDEAVLNQAVALLKAQKPLVRVYNTDDYAKVLARGEVVLSQGFNGQIAKEMAEKPELDFVVPKEGATLWIDNLCVPAMSKRPEHAQAFIDYILRPDVAAKAANYSQYATPNNAGRAKVEPKLLNNAVIYPPADVLKRCVPMEDLGEVNKVVGGLMQELKG
jgi:spermidine/putrescine transport system substrate-binding protein